MMGVMWQVLHRPRAIYPIAFLSGAMVFSFDELAMTYGIAVDFTSIAVPPASLNI